MSAYLVHIRKYDPQNPPPHRPALGGQVDPTVNVKILYFNQ